MGLFDSYFDPEQFQDSGGLLGRLLSLQQQQGQYQSAPGFNAQPESVDAQAQPAAIPMPAPRPTLPQTPDDRPRQTIAVGDYQMPQFGSADPSQGLQQPPGIGDRLSAGFQSWAQTPVGNPFAGLANGIAGFNSGQRTDPAGVVPSQIPAQAPDPGDRLSAGFQSWAHTPVGNPFAALANGVSGFSSGQRSDPAAVAQRILTSQTDATGNPTPDPNDTNATPDGQPRGLAPPIAASKPLGHAPRSARGGARSNMPGAPRLPKIQSHWGNGNGR